MDVFLVSHREQDVVRDASAIGGTSVSACSLVPGEARLFIPPPLAEPSRVSQCCPAQKTRTTPNQPFPSRSLKRVRRDRPSHGHSVALNGGVKFVTDAFSSPVHCKSVLGDSKKLKKNVA